MDRLNHATLLDLVESAAAGLLAELRRRLARRSLDLRQGPASRNLE